jgi:hypothetical protein
MDRNQRLIDDNEKNEIPKSGRVPVPTGNRRHTTAIREGKISGEVFCRDPERRNELGLPPIIVDEVIY